MNVCQQITARVQIIALLVSAVGSSGCTSMKPVTLVSAPGTPKSAEVQAGDTVSFVSNDRNVRLVVASIDGEGLTSKEGVRYQRADITHLKRRSTNWVKTTVLLTGVGIATFFAVALTLFLGDGFLD